ncbi:MAG: FtsB family cell division protein [Patescibacteria group bacterium]
MKAVKNILAVFLIGFLLFSLLKNIFNYRDKMQFFDDYRKDYEAEKKKNIELKTEIVKKKSTTEVEKTIRNDLNLLKENEIAIILPSPTPSPKAPNPASIPSWRQWLDLFIK